MKGKDKIKVKDEKGEAPESKATNPDAVASDAVLDSAIPWLRALGLSEVAEMLQAKPIETITHE
jgi:hypothetical protein